MELLESWNKHNELMAKFLNHVQDDDLNLSITGSKRNLKEIIMHLIDVRNMWALQGKKVDISGQSSIKGLVSEFEESTKRVSALIEKGKVSGFKAGLNAFIVYVISHDSHHRAEVLLILSANNKALKRADDFALWDW